ncbi:MAG TPA: hypothetical protein VEO19_07990 [Terriglobia bacterium]|nr:hypothetical protein [Terriglobia bacterium]
MARDASRRRGTASPMTGDLDRELVAPLQEFDTLARQVSADMLNELAPSMQAWASETTQSIGAAQNALQNFQMVAGGAFQATSDAMAGAGIAAAIYGENVGKAMEKAAKAALASIAEQAGVNALNALAQGLWFLAQAIFFGDPDAAAAAATDFEAAAEWGAIAGVAGAAAAAASGGRALSSGREGAGRAAAGAYGGGGGGPQTGAYGLAPGAASALNPPSGNLTVMVVGEAQAGQWLATTLNTAVQRGVALNATTVQKTPYAAG